jgi:hypothetical protein
MKTSARSKSKVNLSALSLKLEQAEQLAKGMKEQVRRAKARLKVARKALKRARKESRRARKVVKEARRSWESASAEVLAASKRRVVRKRKDAPAKVRAKGVVKQRKQSTARKPDRARVLPTASGVSLSSESAAQPIAALSGASSVTLG